MRGNSLVILAILVQCIFKTSSVVDAISRPGGSSRPTGRPDIDDHQRMTSSDMDQIEQLRSKIDKLQGEVAEIVRSFGTLDIIAKNPSVITQVDAMDDVETRRGFRTRVRARRDVDSPLPLPTSSSNWNSNGHLGPYAYPMFSGQCFMCPAGVPGPRGPPGPAGIKGRDGRDGRDAALQSQEQSSLQLPALEGVNPSGQTAGENAVAHAQLPSERTANSSKGGALYVRWGNSECPTDAHLVYSGTAGGAYYSHAGSGSNYLCLPNDPIYDEVDAVNVERALIYSSEYQTSTAPERMRASHDHTPTCAVCRAPPGRQTKMMIPARNVCPSDEWRLEYTGYLMADKYTSKRTEYVCVDREMETAPGSTGNQNGAQFYMVESRCLTGSGLPCGPYIHGYELTCAVCTI